MSSYLKAMALTKELEERSKAEARAKKEEMIQSPSESFLYSLHTSGTSVADCQLCGRVYFAEHNAGYEEGELEKLKENAKKYPTKYIDVNDESISIVNIGGKQAVVDCECHGLRVYEDFILNEKNLIVEYLSRLNKEEAKLEVKRKEEKKKLKKLSK